MLMLLQMCLSFLLPWNKSREIVKNVSVALNVKRLKMLNLIVALVGIFFGVHEGRIKVLFMNESFDQVHKN